MHSKICTKCKKVYRKPYHESMPCWNKRKYCSVPCRRNAMKECAICNQPFKVRGRRMLTAKFCSYACARKGQMNYKGGISRDPNPSLFYFGQRQKIWKRDKATCQDCFVKEKDMVVHHMTFTKELLPDNLLVLVCRSCHSKRHYEHDNLSIIKL